MSVELCSLLVTAVALAKLNLIGEDDMAVSNLGATFDRVRVWPASTVGDGVINEGTDADACLLCEYTDKVGTLSIAD